MKTGLKSIIVLTLICLISSALLGSVNYFTAPVIEEATQKASQQACFEVMPEGSSFKELDKTNLGLPSKVTTVYEEENGKGYVFKITTKGYDAGLVIMCGINSDGTVTGAKILSSNETPSIGGQCAKASYTSQYIGQTEGLEDVVAISGATLTSTGFKDAVKMAFEAFNTLKGGTK